MVIKGKKRNLVVTSDGSTSKTPISKRSKIEKASSMKGKGVREEVAAGDSLIRPKFINWKFFGKKEMPFRQWFEFQGWMSFLKIKEVMYVLLVKEFFSSLSMEKDETFQVTLKGERFVISLDLLSEAFGIPNRGAKIAKKSEIKKASDFQEDLFKKEICEGKRAGLLDVSSASLSTNYRVLHKFITAFIAPKSGSLDYVSSIELCLMWHIVKKKKFNLCYLIMNLLTSTSKSKSMPYAMLLTVLFDHLSINFSKEMSTALKEKDVIGQSFVSKTKKFKETKEIEATHFVDDDELVSDDEKVDSDEETEKESSGIKILSEEEVNSFSEKEVFASAKEKLPLEISDSVNSEETDSADLETLQEALNKKRNLGVQIKAVNTRPSKLPVKRKIVLTKKGVPKETAHRKKDSKTPSEVPGYDESEKKDDVVEDTQQHHDAVTETEDLALKAKEKDEAVCHSAKANTSKEPVAASVNIQSLLDEKFLLIEKITRESMDLWLSGLKKDIQNLMMPTLSPLKQAEKESKGIDVVQGTSGADPENTEPLEIDSSPASKADQSSIPPSVSKRATRSTTKLETLKVSPGEIGSKDIPAVLDD
ncbi:uncharacterized protein LOC126687900 [Mercurialis annua]|uniref:uncharacterized protein LOC126687900 n=1 Tax=Mercurialis annua TaxID=3986 RepID=UPI00215F11B0|nr:uncharacterized protein LOC126687900 [Mercurialis annua]